MRFYTNQHKYYCGIDLHASSMYLCIIDANGNVLLHKNIQTNPESFLRTISPYRDDLVVGVECVFMWYWISDLCSENDIPFVLGHALYMKSISGGKVKNDRVDSRKLAAMLRGGMFPLAYTYPQHMRATRDLLRRRNYFMRHRAELLGHIQNTNTQYNLTPMLKKVAYKANRPGVAEKFSIPCVRKSIEADLDLADYYDGMLNDLELYIVRNAKIHDAQAFHLLRSVPGIGKILSMVMLYEIHDISRFERVQEFASYARLVKCQHSSAGKIHGSGGRKIGNAHLKWAFSEAAVLFLRGNPRAKEYKARLESKHGKGKALSIIAHKLGRAVYFILQRRKPFDMDRFFNN
jgi:transposase